MNIVLCTREFPGINPSGGIGVYCQAQARELVRQGHGVVVITEEALAPSSEGKKTARPRQPGPISHPDGYRIHLIRSVAGFASDPHGYSYQVYKTLRHLYRQEPFDLVEFPDYQGEGYYTIKAKRLFGEFPETTLVVHGHMSLELCDRLNEEYTSLYRQSIYTIERYCLAHADRATVPCTDLGDLYRDMVPREYRIKSHPVPHFASPPSMRRAVSDSVTFLYVGRMEHRKGVDLLVDASVRLMEKGYRFRVRLIGGDTERQGVSYRAQLIKRIPGPLHPFFEFRGPMNREALTREYQEATVCVFPSRFENWPNVCLEAMSFAKPIIASQRGGMREMLDNGAGWLVDPLQDNALDDALRHALTHPEELEPMGLKALARYREYQTQPPFSYHGLLSPGGMAEAKEVAASDSAQAWPLVSIVVPSFNARHTIKQTIDNLLAVDYPHYEIVVVDDGSTDQQFVAALDKLSQQSDRIRVFHKANSGLPGARNYGARMARGEYLAFCDADDLLHRDMIKDAVGVLRRHPELGTVYPILRYWGDIRGVWGPQDLFLPTVLAENQAHAGLVIRKEVFDAMGGYDESFIYGWEDWDFVIRMAKAGVRGEVLPREGYIYRVHSSSMVRTTPYDTRVLMYRHLWRKHEDLLGVSGAFVLDRELNLPRGSGEPPEIWLRNRILRTAPVRALLFIAKFIPKPIKSPVRRVAKGLVLRWVRH